MENLIYLLEDDEDIADSLEYLLKEEKRRFEWFKKGESLLEQIQKDLNNSDKLIPGCILIDIRLSDELGTVVFETMLNMFEFNTYPVIFLTGHGNVLDAVKMLKLGAFDFLQKPVDGETLEEIISKALKVSKKRLINLKIRENFISRKNLLTEQEENIMKLIVNGKTNKEISLQLGNSIRTVELHRSRIFEKMGVVNAIELYGKIEQYNSTNL